jgi:hypothetical protein
MKTALKSLSDRTIEWFSASVMLIWGATLALPGELLNQPTFVAFHRFGLTEDFWAIAFGGVGMARLVSLFINGRWPRSAHIRMAGGLFGALSWGQVAWLLYESSAITATPILPGPGVYALLAAFEVFAINRAAFDARYYNP